MDKLSNKPTTKLKPNETKNNDHHVSKNGNEVKMGWKVKFNTSYRANSSNYFH